MSHLNSSKINNDPEKFWLCAAVLLLVFFFVCGLLIFRDYGASSDEINQIEAGHIIWTTICEKLGKTPPDFGSIPKLDEYYNRYYGQAATFPTVIIEALNGFRMDSSSIIRLRHLWNFLLYFCGLISLAILIQFRFHRYNIVFFVLLIHILTPRLFGDAFYNDRDVLLISLLWISLLSFTLFQRKPGVFTALFAGFCFAASINTRYFALILLILPLLYLIRSGGKNVGKVLLLFSSAAVFFWLLTPVLWKDFIKEFAAGFHIFSSGVQRTQETMGNAEILFFGKNIPENDLPFYYLPLWIFISTPLIPQILCILGLICSFRNKIDLIDQFMWIILCPCIAAVMLIRPVLYNGWRHMYFFYVPIFWFAAIGLDWLLNHAERKYSAMTGVLVLLSAIWTAFRIFSLHPYECLYLNPLFNSKTAEFDRDYWRLSTTDCMKWILNQEEDAVRVNDTNAGINNNVIGLLPGDRQRILIGQYNALHRIPSDYLVFNYSGKTGNEQNYPLFTPVYSIERSGTKIAEVFKRDSRYIPVIRGFYSDLPEIINGESGLTTEWRSEALQNSEDEIVIEFDSVITLSGISVLPGDDEQEYARSPEVSVSLDGETWKTLTISVSDLYDYSFPQTETKWLRIRNTENRDVHWSVREIEFYGNQD